MKYLYAFSASGTACCRFVDGTETLICIISTPVHRFSLTRLSVSDGGDRWPLTRHLTTDAASIENGSK